MKAVDPNKAAPAEESPEGVVATGDLLRPTRTRATGTKTIAMYGFIAIIVVVSTVFVVGLFSPPKPVNASMSAIGDGSSGAGSGRPQSTDLTYRYSGKVVPNYHDDRAMRGSSPNAYASPGTAANTYATPTPGVAQNDVNAANSAADLAKRQHDEALRIASTLHGTAATDSYVPDTTEAYAASHRLVLPTPAPGEVGPGMRSAQTDAATPHGIQVVYGAPNTAQTPVPAAGAPTSESTQGAAAVAAAFQAVRDAPQAAVAPPSAPTSSIGGTLKAETMPGLRRPPTARYMIVGGTPIEVQLDVAIESDVPGPVVAHVVRDIVDPLSGATLIPGGSKVLGVYTGLAGGESRLSLVWSRIIFPDRSSFALDKAPALDSEGRVGVGGTLNTHDGALIRRTLISGVLAQIAARIAPAPSTTNVVVVNTPTGTQPGVSASVLDLANQLNARDAKTAATVSIAANTIFSIYVDRDMLFTGPYAPMTAGP